MARKMCACEVLNCATPARGDMISPENVGSRRWHIICTRSVTQWTERARVQLCIQQNNKPQTDIIMKTLNQLLALAGFSAALALSTGNLAAQDQPQRQGRGNFDPAQFQQQRLERIKEQMGVTDEAEWKAVQDRIQKVFDAQTAVVGFRGRGGFGRGGRGGGGADNAGGGNNGGGRRGGFGAPSPELESLQNAIQNNAPSEQIKAALEKYRAARKAKEVALDKAQAELQKILSVKQEAVAVTNGLLN